MKLLMNDQQMCIIVTILMLEGVGCGFLYKTAQLGLILGSLFEVIDTWLQY